MQLKVNTKLILFFSVILLSSCTVIYAEPTKQPTDKNWLQNPACEFPCWQNITPQKTSFDDVMPILSQANITIAFRSRTEKSIGFQFQDTIAGNISSTPHGLVDYINLSVHYEEITLGDLEEIIGQPEKVNLVKSYSGNQCEPRLLFVTEGIIVDIFPLDDLSGYFRDALVTTEKLLFGSTELRVRDDGVIPAWQNAKRFEIDKRFLLIGNMVASFILLSIQIGTTA